jgi:hypothetical protein
MKNFIKIVTISSFLIITSLLIGACGGGNTEQFVQGKGQIDVTAKDAAGVLLSNVRIDVRIDSLAGSVIDTWTTDSSGKHTFQETIASNYYFTFTDVASPVRYATQNYSNNPVKPLLTSTVTINVTMAP